MTGAPAGTPPGSTAARVPPAERGATRIADRVVAGIAAQAAREALREGAGAGAGAGAGPGAKGTTGDAGETGTAEAAGQGVRPWPRGGAPHASVTVRDRIARIRVSVELGYPSDIGAQCGAVRRHVALRVRELTGMEVPDVAVGVERLHSAHLGGDAARRVQ